MFQLTGEELFGIYAEKWEKNERNPISKMRAFTIKAIQKLKE
jgi:hypothetical protein